MPKVHISPQSGRQYRKLPRGRVHERVFLCVYRLPLSVAIGENVGEDRPVNFTIRSCDRYDAVGYCSRTEDAYSQLVKPPRLPLGNWVGLNVLELLLLIDKAAGQHMNKIVGKNGLNCIGTALHIKPPIFQLNYEVVRVCRTLPSRGENY